MAAIILMRRVTVVVCLLVRQLAVAAAALPRSRPASEPFVVIVEEASLGTMLGFCAEIATGSSGMMLPLFVIVLGLSGSIMTITAIIGLVEVALRSRCWEGVAPVDGPNARPLTATRVRWASGPRASLAMGLAHARCPGAHH